MGNKKSSTANSDTADDADMYVRRMVREDANNQNTNAVLKEMYGLSTMTLSYIEKNCNNSKLISDIKSIKKCHVIDNLLKNNFKIYDFEVSIIVLIVEYVSYVTFTMSNEISDRSHCDGAQNMDLIDTTFKMPKDGIVTEWVFYARRTSTLYGTVWRSTNLDKYNGKFNNTNRRPEYKLIAIVKFDEIRSDHSANRYIISENEAIEVLKGDCVGIRWGGRSSIPSDIGHGKNKHQVYWSYPTATPKVGEVKTFYVGNQRDYAYGFVAEC